MLCCPERGNDGAFRPCILPQVLDVSAFRQKGCILGPARKHEIVSLDNFGSCLRGYGLYERGSEA